MSPASLTELAARSPILDHQRIAHLDLARRVLSRARDEQHRRRGDPEQDRAASANAAVIAGYVPALEVSRWPVRTAVGWAVVDGDRIAIDGELDANDEASSKRVLFESVYWGSNFIGLTADCQAQLSRVAKQLRVDRTGARIVFHADLAATEVARLATCGGAP